MEKYILLLKQKFKDWGDDKFEIFSGLFATSIYAISVIISLETIFSNINILGGLTKNYFFILFALTQILIGIMFTFAYPMSASLLENYIQDSLSVYLTKPSSVLARIFFIEPDLNGIFVSLIGFSILIFYRVPFEWINLLFSIGFLLLSIIIIFCLFITFGCIGCIFRSEAITSFIIRSSDILRYPLTIFPSALQFFIIFIIPVGLLCYVPIIALQGKLTLGIVLQFFLAFIINIIISFVSWKFILYKYRNG